MRVQQFGWQVVVFCLFIGCYHDNSLSLINLNHLNSLFETVPSSQGEMGIIHIYSEYPDYGWVEAPGEGIACVDDAARALLVYWQDYQRTGREDSWNRLQKLVRFLLFMQSKNGAFYNFLKSDYTINRDHPNSQNKPSWWTWRAQWALSCVLPLLQKKNARLTAQVDSALTASFSIYSRFAAKPLQTVSYEGFICPANLPAQTAADQASIIVLAIAAYLRADGSANPDSLKQFGKMIGESLLQMQTGDTLVFPFGVFRSWRNIWHPWGNFSALALMQIGPILHRVGFWKAGLKEVRFFYPYLLNQQFLHEMVFRKEGAEIILLQAKQFPQIAYDIRPLVFSSLQAYSLTKEPFYARLAGQLAAWLVGNNPLHAAMYDSTTGRCYDGIVAPGKINRNAGAESTIEALLILQAISRNTIALKAFRDWQRRIRYEK